MPYDLDLRDDELLQVGLLYVVFTVAVACHLTACLLLGGAFPGFEQSLSPVQRMCPVPDKNTVILRSSSPQSPSYFPKICILQAEYC